MCRITKKSKEGKCQNFPGVRALGSLGRHLWGYVFFQCTHNIPFASSSNEMFNHLFSALYQLMARNTTSPVSVVMLLTCLAILVATQYPLVLSWLQGSFSLGSSTLSAQSGFRSTSLLAHGHGMQKIEFKDGSNRKKARERVLKQLIKTKGWERDTSHPRRRVLAALVGFLEYREKMEEGVQRKRSAWAKLSVRQKEVRFVYYAVTLHR